MELFQGLFQLDRNGCLFEEKIMVGKGTPFICSQGIFCVHTIIENIGLGGE
jgi:hypothetical protein